MSSAFQIPCLENPNPDTRTPGHPDARVNRVGVFCAILFFLIGSIWVQEVRGQACPCPPLAENPTIPWIPETATIGIPTASSLCRFVVTYCWRQVPDPASFTGFIIQLSPQCINQESPGDPRDCDDFFNKNPGELHQRLEIGKMLIAQNPNCHPEWTCVPCSLEPVANYEMWISSCIFPNGASCFPSAYCRQKYVTCCDQNGNVLFEKRGAPYLFGACTPGCNQQGCP